MAAPHGLLGGIAISTDGWELAGSGSSIHTSCKSLGKAWHAYHAGLQDGACMCCSPRCQVCMFLPLTMFQLTSHGTLYTPAVQETS